MGGKIAYVPQTPWVQQVSIRDNVTFGQRYEKDKYESTLNASALLADLPSFVFGDRTEVGEGGINISGGTFFKFKFEFEGITSFNFKVKNNDLQLRVLFIPMPM